MKALALGLGIAFAATQVAHACNDELFSINDWQVKASEDGRNVRTVVGADVTYKGARVYRMIHGAVLFSDALGNALVTVPIEADANVEPGDSFAASGAFLGSTSRITSINPDDVIAETCVWSIIYDDGTVERFDQ